MMDASFQLKSYKHSATKSQEFDGSAISLTVTEVRNVPEVTVENVLFVARMSFIVIKASLFSRKS